jgi:hypothetical protein
LYDGLEEAVACTTARRRLSLGLYDGSEEEAVAWLGGGLSLGLYDDSEEAVAWLGVALAFTRGTINQL